MQDTLKIALAQINLLVGDVHGNAARVIAARSAPAMTSELTWCCSRS